jgi:hypothetical protein
LQRRRAVPVHRRTGSVEARQDTDDAAKIETLLAARQAAAADQVLDVGRGDLRHLLEHPIDHLGAQVVGSNVDQ